MSDDMSPREQQIRERAHQLWEEAGRPEGRDNEFWEEARHEVEREARKVPRR